MPRQIDSVPISPQPKTLDSPHKIRIHVAVTPRADSSIADTTSRRFAEATAWQLAAGKYSGNFIRQGYGANRLFGFSASPVLIRSNKKVFHGKETFFYSMVALLLLFAFLRYSFPKYFVDLFRVAFRTTLKQRQIGEQLVQTPLPSLLLNFFFLIVASIYIGFVFQHYHLAENYNFWLLNMYFFVALAVIYAIKFLSLKFCGWLFNITPTTDGYIFIVFLINKVIGIYLLPFVVLLAFTDRDLYEISFTISYIGVLVLFAYRFILAYELARSQIKVNPFHFFLYLCAFEIVPLLLIYKALLLWF